MEMSVNVALADVVPLVEIVETAMVDTGDVMLVKEGRRVVHQVNLRRPSVEDLAEAVELLLEKKVIAQGHCVLHTDACMRVCNVHSKMLSASVIQARKSQTYLLG